MYQPVNTFVYVEVPFCVHREDVSATVVEGIQEMLVYLPSSKQLLGPNYVPGMGKISSKWEIDPKHRRFRDLNHCRYLS